MTGQELPRNCWWIKNVGRPNETVPNLGACAAVSIYNLVSSVSILYDEEKTRTTAVKLAPRTTYVYRCKVRV